MVAKPIIPLALGAMPFLKLLLAYLSGIVLAQTVHWTHALVYCLLGILLAFVLLLFGSVFYRFPRNILTILLYLSWGSLGVLQYGRSLPESQRDYIADRTFDQLVAEVQDEPVQKGNTIRIRIQLKAGLITTSDIVTSVSGRALLTIYADSITPLSLKYGDLIQFPANLKPVAPPYNPQEFNYRQYLARRGIHHQQRLPISQVVVLQSRITWYSYMLKWKEKIVKQFRDNISDQASFSVASALVFGYRAELDPQVYTAFKDTGTIHILSVSGMHVSMVFILLTFLLRPLDRWFNGRWFRFTIVLIFIWIYVILTGMAPPILRAGIMISFFVVSQWIGRRQQGLNALFASGFFILWYEPGMLFDVGFQLSYLAMLGIFLIFPLLRSLYLPHHSGLKILFEYGYISIAAQLVTAPLTLYYFGQFPNYFLLANLFIAIPATVIMYLGVALMLLPVPWIASIVGALENMAVHVMVSTLQWIGGLPGATWQGISFTMSQMVLLYAVMITLFVAINYRVKQSLFLFAIGILFSIGLALWQWNQAIQYRGIHIYQMRQHIAIAWYERGHVVLFSSLDSLTHSGLQYAVVPDLTYYREANQIKIVQISPQQNGLLTLGDTVFYVWNEGDYDPPANADVVLIRNNRILSDQYPLCSALHILDGSNSAYHVTKIAAELHARKAECYILKDNFAYVWNTK